MASQALPIAPGPQPQPRACFAPPCTAPADVPHAAPRPTCTATPLSHPPAPHRSYDHARGEVVTTCLRGANSGSALSVRAFAFSPRRPERVAPHPATLLLLPSAGTGAASSAVPAAEGQAAKPGSASGSASGSSSVGTGGGALAGFELTCRLEGEGGGRGIQGGCACLCACVHTLLQEGGGRRSCGHHHTSRPPLPHSVPASRGP